MNFIVFFITFLVALVAAARKHYSGYEVLQVTPENATQLRVLKKIHENYEGHDEVQFWKTGLDVKRSMDIQVAPVVASKIKNQLSQNGMVPNVIIDDMGRFLRHQKRARRRKTKSSGAFQLDVYHEYDEIVSYLRGLTSNNEGTELRSIGQTIEGREIYMFSIASGKKKAISIECNIHAREWITGATCINIITNLVTNETEKELKEAFDWYFIPIANPDGFAYTWSDDRMWRKNRRVQSDCDGVDLNRNFDANFGGPGTSSSQCSQVYHGEYAFSEPETQAERDFILSLKGRLLAHWSLHAYSELYLLPYCYTYDLPEDYQKLLDIAEASGDAIQKTHGKHFSIGGCASTIYIASGGTHDWVYNAASPKFSATIELRDTGRYGFLLPENQIMPVYEETWNGLKAAIDALRKDRKHPRSLTDANI